LPRGISRRVDEPVVEQDGEARIQDESRMNPQRIVDGAGRMHNRSDRAADL